VGYSRGPIGAEVCPVEDLGSLPYSPQRLVDGSPDARKIVFFHPSYDLQSTSPDQLGKKPTRLPYRTDYAGQTVRGPWGIFPFSARHAHEVQGMTLSSIYRLVENPNFSFPLLLMPYFAILPRTPP